MLEMVIWSSGHLVIARRKSQDIDPRPPHLQPVARLDVWLADALGQASGGHTRAHTDDAGTDIQQQLGVERLIRQMLALRLPRWHGNDAPIGCRRDAGAL